ncbi:LysR family transcriptional regulator [Eremococcus coleocola]|uniref:LysR family transcriptional regulator n=1 Tax=Eremococcus coleocola TaxID=88132 RepID=UPI00041402BA|nr:LysR family transcriptional regulator [Eremococcus coleocola]
MDWKSINFQHLNYFLIAAKYQNYSQAADELFINYSTLSKAIAAIENQLGVKLFEKDGRNIKLTKYGKILNASVYAAMTSIEDGLDEIARFSHPDHGQVNISSIYTVSAKYLPRLLSRFRNLFPELSLDITQASTQQIIDYVLDGTTDIGFCGEFDYSSYSSELNREFIYNDEIVLIVPANHRFAARKSVSFAEIKNEQFIGWNASAGMYYAIQQAINRVAGPNFKLNTIYSMNEDTGVVGMVRAGLGIAFSSKNTELNYDDIRILELTDLYIIYNVYMIWANSEFTPSSLKSFKDFIIAQIN